MRYLCHHQTVVCVCLFLVTLSCSSLYDHMDCSQPGSSAHEDSPGKNTGVGCHALLQGIFPTQGSNPGLPQCRQILYHLSHQGSPDKGPTTCLREFSVDKMVWFHVSSSHGLGAAREQVASKLRVSFARVIQRKKNRERYMQCADQNDRPDLSQTRRAERLRKTEAG